MYFTFHLDILLNVIINTYFNNSVCAFVITENTGFNYVGFLPIINIKLSESYELNIEHLLVHGCQEIIIQVDKPGIVISKFENAIKMQEQRYNNRRFLIIPTNQTKVIDLEKIPKHPDINFVPNILIVVPQSLNCVTHVCDNIFKLITHKFVGRNNNNETVVLDYWHSINNSFEQNNCLYPDKLSNMQGRLFRMATFSYKPYSIIGPTMAETDGTEMRVALEYAAKHNATIEFVVDEVYEWGEIYDNWTGNGILGNVVLDNADLGFGALYTWYHEYFFLDLTLPVVRTGITCLAPTPLLQSGLLVPFFPFNYTLWIAVLSSFVVCLISYTFIFYLNYIQRKRQNDPDADVTDPLMIFLLMTRIYLLQSWPTIRSLNKPSIRVILTGILIFSLLISSCYNSGLASSLTVPRYGKAIKTVEDLADSNIKWGATHEAWIFSILSATEPSLVKIRNNFKTFTEVQLRKRTTTRDFAFSIERLPFGHYAIGSYITGSTVQGLLLMTEDIYWEQCVLMTRKNSPFLSSLNQLILQIHETGLPYIWETYVALHYLDNQVQMAVKVLSLGHYSDNNQPVQLKLSHVEGVFTLWAIGLFVALLVFVLENLIYKCKNTIYLP